MMKQSKDPFEAAFVEEEDSPPESPASANDNVAQICAGLEDEGNQPEDEGMEGEDHTNVASTSAVPSATAQPAQLNNTIKDEDEDEEDDHMDVETEKLPSTGDPDKLAKIQAILSQFTEEQMSRYEAFRRSGFQKSNMRRLLVSVTGSQKISIPMTILVSGIAKMFVGELVETARIVISERQDSGPIRPCHMREAYRRLKLEGKVPRKSVPRLFH